MGLWYFMAGISLLIPLTLIVFGSYFIKSATKKINYFFGYRTSMSMKNKNTWAFAHTYCGKLWRTIGWIMLPLSVSAMLFVPGKDTHAIAIFGNILCVIQLVFAAGPIIFTEIALNKHFDRNGNSKDEIY
jgi:uncharacterized membrane protein